VPAAARECHFCRRGLLVDLVLDGAVEPGWAARLAADLAGVARADLDEVRRRLGAAPGTVFEGLTRAEAQACQVHLERGGVPSRVVPGRQSAPKRVARSGADRLPRVRRPRPGLVLAVRLAALGLVAAAAVWWFARPAGVPSDQTGRERPLGFRGGVADGRRVWVEPEGASSDRARLAGGFAVAGHRLVTSAQVAAGVGDRVRVDGRTVGRVVALDEWLGVAVVELAEPAGSPLALGSCAALRVGDRVVLPGTAAASGTVTAGPVRHLGLAFLEVDAQVAENDSGGPVLGPEGKVVGVLQWHLGVDGPRALVLPVDYLVTGPDALAGGGPPVPSSAWQAVLDTAGLGAERRPELLAEDLERPILLGVRLEGRQALKVMLAMHSARAPSGTDLDFALTRGGETVCALGGRVPIWHPVGPGEVETRSPPAVRWLERHGRPLYLYSATLELGLSGCDPQRVPGGELVVRGGLPGADRCQVETGIRRIRGSAERRRSWG
jgi:S1-C subfamily serine protease